MIAFELSRYCFVVLTDENNTSKLCSFCKDELKHPQVNAIKKTTFKDKTGKREIKREIVKRDSHTLCVCNNESHLLTNNGKDVHKVWLNRDYNAGRNILHVGTTKLLGKDLKQFKRRKMKNEESLSCSLDQLDAEKSVPKKKLSPLWTMTSNQKKTKIKPLNISSKLKKKLIIKKILII